MCVVAFLIGMLLAHMLKNVCGCKDVIEGTQETEPSGHPGDEGEGPSDTSDDDSSSAQVEKASPTCKDWAAQFGLFGNVCGEIDVLKKHLENITCENGTCTANDCCERYLPNTCANWAGRCPEGKIRKSGPEDIICKKYNACTEDDCCEVPTCGGWTDSCPDNKVKKSDDTICKNGPCTEGDCCQFKCIEATRANGGRFSKYMEAKAARWGRVLGVGNTDLDGDSNYCWSDLLENSLTIDQIRDKCLELGKDKATCQSEQDSIINNESSMNCCKWQG